MGSDGSPDGYDIALVKAVAEKLGDYEFTYKAISWGSIFSSLDAQASNRCRRTFSTAVAPPGLPHPPGRSRTSCSACKKSNNARLR